MESIRGIVGVDVAGEPRTLVCDFQAADVLYACLGPHWYIWLCERFVGREAKLPTGEKARKFEPLSPRDLATVLYAMLAADRAKSGRTETLETLMQSITPFAFPELQQALTKAVIASLGVPGEVRGADESAVAVPGGSGRAITHGTGAAS